MTVCWSGLAWTRGAILDSAPGACARGSAIVNVNKSFGAKPGVNRRQMQEAAHQEPGGDQQHHGNHDPVAGKLAKGFAW